MLHALYAYGISVQGGRGEGPRFDSMIPFSSSRQDYKAPDGSKEEETVLHRAYGHSSRRQALLAALVEEKVSLSVVSECNSALSQWPN